MATSRAEVARRVAVTWSLLAGVWLVFTGSTAPAELALGAVAAALATLAMRVVQFRKLARVAPLGRAFAQAWRIPGIAVTGTWEALGVVARQLAGKGRAPSLLFAAPYSAVADDDPAATRRALATAYTTITPNFVVIDIDQEHRLLYFHQVKASPVPKMTRALGAER